MSSRVLGAVLVGGASRRMGRDKALLRWRDETLVGRAARVLGEVIGDVVIVGGRPEVFGFAGLPVLADLRPGLGPLGGLETALRHAAGRSVFALACDLPAVSAALIRLLTETAERREGGPALAWMPSVDGSKQPLCAFYDPRCAGPLREYLGANRREALGFAAAVGAEVVEISRRHPLYSPHLLANVNRPADLEALAAAEPWSEEVSR